MSEQFKSDIEMRRPPARVSVGGGQVLNLYKQLGETPLERLERLRVQRPEYAHEVLSYAGRLDPMAEGVLIALAGSANKEREAYLGMSKEYVLDILFGFSTDTYDLLGRVMESVPDPMVGGTHGPISKKRVFQGLNEFRGEFNQEYPPFSSKTVEGKALFSWAREGGIHNLVLPKKEVNIYEISVKEMYKLSEPIFLSYIESSVGKVNGDFRQDEVLRLWKKHLHVSGKRTFPCVTIAISCSSGTYARSLAHRLGLELGLPAIALHILRTKVGEYSMEKSLR
jgi:tRNA pseudouridine55 synthase